MVTSETYRLKCRDCDAGFGHAPNRETAVNFAHNHREETGHLSYEIEQRRSEDIAL